MRWAPGARPAGGRPELKDQNPQRLEPGLGRTDTHMAHAGPGVGPPQWAHQRGSVTAPRVSPGQRGSVTVPRVSPGLCPG